MDDVIKPVKELWQDYLFLTREMAKFLAQNNFDMFYELMDQRERLQKIIDAAQDNEFRSSPAGQEILNFIRQENANIVGRLQLGYNSAKRSHMVSSAYDSLGAASEGSRLNLRR